MFLGYNLGREVVWSVESRLESAVTRLCLGYDSALWHDFLIISLGFLLDFQGKDNGEIKKMIISSNFFVFSLPVSFSRLF